MPIFPKSGLLISSLLPRGEDVPVLHVRSYLFDLRGEIRTKVFLLNFLDEEFQNDIFEAMKKMYCCLHGNVLISLDNLTRHTFVDEQPLIFRTGG